MKEYKGKITQQMVEYVEQHKVPGEIRYPEDFHLQVGEEYIIRGIRDDRSVISIDLKEGGCNLPAVFFDFDVDECIEAWKAESERKEMERLRKERNKNTDWCTLRQQAAIRILAGLVSNRAIRVDEEDNDPEELERQARTTKRCAYTAVKYADALIE